MAKKNNEEPPKEFKRSQNIKRWSLIIVRKHGNR